MPSMPMLSIVNAVMSILLSLQQGFFPVKFHAHLSVHLFKFSTCYLQVNGTVVQIKQKHFTSSAIIHVSE